MYLNVTGLTTYNVDHDSFCIRWTPHRAATSYRLKVNPVDRKRSARVAPFLISLNQKLIPAAFLPLASKNGAQEITVRGSESSHCFPGLAPDTLYNATVFTQTPNLEGPGVSVQEKTRKIASSAPLKRSASGGKKPPSHSWLPVELVSLLSPAVMKPTEVPTQPPTPPAPVTVPPALDGEFLRISV